MYIFLLKPEKSVFPIMFPLLIQINHQLLTVLLPICIHSQHKTTSPISPINSSLIYNLRYKFLNKDHKK